MPLRRIVLWLFVINLGIAFGAGLYEMRVEFPHWLVETADGVIWNSQAARDTDSGFKFWAFVSTGPLTLLTLISAMLAWKSPGELRRWWLLAVGIILVERLLTFTYFIPNMISLMQMPSSAEAIERARAWNKMNGLRHILNFAGWISALKAFTVVHR